MAAADNPPIQTPVSSIAARLRTQVQELAVIPPAGLQYWLPGLSVPEGWLDAQASFGVSQPARVLTRRAGAGIDSWNGCDVLNLFRFKGTAPDGVVQESADCTLKDLGTTAPLTYRVNMPTELGITAVRSRGTVDVGRRVWMQVTNFLVSSAGEGALIEHTTMVDAQSRAQLTAEISELSEGVRSALIASVSANLRRPGVPDHLVNPIGSQRATAAESRRPARS